MSAVPITTITVNENGNKICGEKYLRKKKIKKKTEKLRADNQVKKK